MPDPSVRLTRSEHEQTSFERVEGAPDPALSGLVHRYAGYSHRSLRSLSRREPAQGMVTVILNFGPTIRVRGPASFSKEAGSFIAALNDSYAITDEDSTSDGLQVDLSPLGAHMLLGVSMRDLSELIVSLEDVIGPPASLLVEQLFEAANWKARFRILDTFVLARIAEAAPPSPDVAWAWRRLSETGGRLPIKALAAELGCSRRLLASRFREQIGPPPKTAARILRFRRATEMLASHDDRRISEIALDCGYYDQAHFNRDFRDLAGTTPSAFLGNRLPGSFGVSA